MENILHHKIKKLIVENFLHRHELIMENILHHKIKKLIVENFLHRHELIMENILHHKINKLIVVHRELIMENIFHCRKSTMKNLKIVNLKIFIILPQFHFCR